MNCHTVCEQEKILWSEYSEVLYMSASPINTQISVMSDDVNFTRTQISLVINIHAVLCAFSRSVTSQQANLKVI